MPKDYIVLDKDDMMFLTDDEEVRCVTKSGETIYIVTENGYNSIVNAVSEEDWKNCNDPLYILYNIYFKYIKQYNKEDLAKILEGYIK